MAELYTADTPAQVRAAIDPTLQSETVPDEMIAMPIYSGVALTEVTRRDPLATTYTDTAKIQNARNAVVFLTAARIAPILPVVLQEQLGDYRYTMATQDLDKLAERLRALADEAIQANIATDGNVAPLDAFFTVAGSRGF